MWQKMYERKAKDERLKKYAKLDPEALEKRVTALEQEVWKVNARVRLEDKKTYPTHD